MLTRFSLFLLYFYGYFFGVKEHLRGFGFISIFFLLREHLDSVSLLPPRFFFPVWRYYITWLTWKSRGLATAINSLAEFAVFDILFFLHSFYFSGVAWSLVLIWLRCFETFQRTGAVKYKSHEVTNDMSKIGKEVFLRLGWNLVELQ